MNSTYEVHIYKDGTCETYDTNIGGGHGEKIIYVVREAFENMKPYLEFKYIKYESNSKQALKFHISLDEFKMSVVPADIIFKCVKETYDIDGFMPCNPMIYSNKTYNLAALGEADSEIVDILKQIEL